jgi:V/A-type H+-transporting ATPase subunit D
MAKKIKLTRPELKRQRDALARFERYLPMLKLKQQQLQGMVQRVRRECREAEAAMDEAQAKVDSYKQVLTDVAGLNVEALGQCEEVRTTETNIAGVAIPVFEEALFPEARYSLFSTPAWVDAALVDLREVSARRGKMEISQRQLELLSSELTKIMQRVNLFDKVMIPDARESIRRIRIQLGDEMAAAVGRAKIAKGKLTA